MVMRSELELMRKSGTLGVLWSAFQCPRHQKGWLQLSKYIDPTTLILTTVLMECNGLHTERTRITFRSVPRISRRQRAKSLEANSGHVNNPVMVEVPSEKPPMLRFRPVLPLAFVAINIASLSGFCPVTMVRTYKRNAKPVKKELPRIRLDNYPRFVLVIHFHGTGQGET